MENVSQDKEIKQKKQDTCELNYGVPWPQQSKEVREKTIDTNKSRYEDFLAEKLKQNFETVLRQYYSEEYPFRCDFYISEIDTYIEANLHWTHGGRPFAGTDEDYIKLNHWVEKSKSSDYYSIAIQVWTDRDVIKRNLAYSNGLNYIEIFSLKHFEETVTNIIEQKDKEVMFI